MIALTPELLLRAYAAGIFPMAESADDPELFWVDPVQRGILPLDRFHLPRRLRAHRAQRRASTMRCDAAFEAVMRGCAEPTAERPQTWINDEIVAALRARSSAAASRIASRRWRDGELVGGLYGVSLGAAFFGESMFSRVTDASKVALGASRRAAAAAAASACSTRNSSPSICSVRRDRDLARATITAA